MVSQIHKLFRDDMFNSLLLGDEKQAWDAFRLVSTNFLGNTRGENYKEMIEDMSLYHKIGCNMSLRMHIFIPTWISSPTTSAWLMMSTVNIFIRKLQRRRNDIRESGPLPCWLTAVGRSPEMFLSSYTSDRQSEVARKSGLLSLNV